MKVILLTARKSELEIAKGLKLGADDYITKPFSNATLVKKVKDLLSCPINEGEPQESTKMSQVM